MKYHNNNIQPYILKIYNITIQNIFYLYADALFNYKLHYKLYNIFFTLYKHHNNNIQHYILKIYNNNNAVENYLSFLQNHNHNFISQYSRKSVSNTVTEDIACSEAGLSRLSDDRRTSQTGTESVRALLTNLSLLNREIEDV